MNKISYYLVLIVGITACLSFIPHAFFGFPAVLEHIRKGEINGAATNGMQMIWLYSSIMMLLSGIWMLYLSKPIKTGDSRARIQVLLLGIGLSIFGVSCTYISGQIDGMVSFAIEGVLLLLAATVFFKSVKNE